MKFYAIDSNNPEPKIMDKAVRILNHSGVVAHATETVYGLAAKWDDWAAIKKVSRIKQRAFDKPYSIMVTSPFDIIEISGLDSPSLHRLLDGVFPGPVTLLLKRKRSFKPDYWNQFGEIGFRIPDHHISLELIKMSQTPLITTSANLASADAPSSAQEISENITDAVDCVLDSGPCLHAIPSTVIRIDLNQPTYTILRSGAFPADQFHRVFTTIW